MFHVASAMTECGVSAHEKCSIYGANCAQWMIAMQVLSASWPELQGVWSTLYQCKLLLKPLILAVLSKNYRVV